MNKSMKELPVAVVEPDDSNSYVMNSVLKRHGYIPHTVKSIEECLGLIKGTSVKLMLVAEEIQTSRYNAYDFCRAINKTYRGSIPVIITSGKPTEGGAVLSIRNGALGYLVKPATEQVMVKKIEEVLNRGNEQFIVANNIKEFKFEPGASLSDMIDVIINEADEIRALPQAVAKITQVSEDEKAGAAAMDQAISSDPAIAGLVIKKANSAYYKGKSQIVNVKQAVVRIGFNECRNMVLGFSVFKLFSTKDKNFGFNRLAFWLHSVAVGVVAESLGKKLRCEHENDLFMAGLLHDFGKLILDDYLSAQFQRALQLANINNIPLYEAEHKVFEKAHSAVSKAVMEKWNFPEHIANAGLRHHVVPQHDAKPGFNETLYIANQLAKASLLGGGGDTIPSAIPENLWSIYGIEDSFDDEFISNYFDKTKQFLEFLSIDPRKTGINFEPLLNDNPKEILFVKSPGMDHRPLVFFLQCQGYKLTIIRAGSEIPDLDPVTVMFQAVDREIAAEVCKQLIKSYPGVPIIMNTPNFKYSNPLYSGGNLRVIEGPVDYRSLSLMLK